mgnify:CR=1 FL=1
MADSLFINEEFYKKNISHKQSVDHAQIISSIRLVQKTNLISVITQSIYDLYQTKIVDGTVFTAGEEKLFGSIQLYLAVKTAQEIIYASPVEAKDGSHISYKQKTNLMEARVIRDINRDPLLLALAQSDSLEFDDEEMDSAGGFYFI